MDKRGNIALGEWMLLGLTGLFLCLLLGLFLHDRAALAIPAAAETERSAPTRRPSISTPPRRRRLPPSPASGRSWPGGSRPTGRPTGPSRPWRI